MKGKYKQENLVPALRLFVEARNKAITFGFTDNGGAIHSVERILDILGQRICYPQLRHINDLKSYHPAEMSLAACEARQRGERVLIEHVMPQRAFAQAVIGLIESGATDEELVEYIRTTYRLVLLTREEASALNRRNRSRMTSDRIAEAGIVLYFYPPSA